MKKRLKLIKAEAKRLLAESLDFYVIHKSPLWAAFGVGFTLAFLLCQLASVIS